MTPEDDMIARVAANLFVNFGGNKDFDDLSPEEWRGWRRKAIEVLTVMEEPTATMIAAMEKEADAQVNVWSVEGLWRKAISDAKGGLM